MDVCLNLINYILHIYLHHCLKINILLFLVLNQQSKSVPLSRQPTFIECAYSNKVKEYTYPVLR